MRNSSLKAAIITTVITCVTTQFAIGQFNMQNNLANYWGSLDYTLSNPPQAIGIGNFPGATPVLPASALHINTNLVTNPFYGAGEVFRTDAPDATAGDHTYWRLLHGGTELFNIHSLYNDDDVYIGTVEPHHLHFFTNDQM